MPNKRYYNMALSKCQEIFKKIGKTLRNLADFGAAGRSRTDTELPPTDFESVASANFTTAA